MQTVHPVCMVFQAFFIPCTIDNTVYQCYLLQYGKTHEKK